MGLDVAYIQLVNNVAGRRDVAYIQLVNKAMTTSDPRFFCQAPLLLSDEALHNPLATIEANLAEIM